jgi:hypothetical protein
MDRRTFVGASAAVLGSSAALAAAPAGRELYELRTYTLKPDKRPLLDEYLAKAYIPAVKRHRAGPVGVFVANPENDLLRVFVLVVHPGADSAAAMPARLTADAEYRDAAGAYLAARAADPVYQRIETSLLSAIAGMPRLERPDASKPRLFNLRVYESHNERAAAKKIEMFESGELAIFRRVGLRPVFFAAAVAGAAMPNLTYLLVFPDEAGRKTAWDTFRADPAWLKLKAIPEYADKEIVSRITNHILAPATYSEL